MAEIARRLGDNAEALERARQRERDVPAARDAARHGDLAGSNEPSEIGKRIRRVSDAVTSTVAAMASDTAGAAPAAIAAIAQLAQERVMGANDMVSVAYLELAMAAARSVCRVRLRAPGGKSLGFGTGFMVSPRLMLTNHHVLPDASAAANALAEFDYQDDCDGLPLEPRLFALEPGRFFAAEKSLDWTLVALADRANDRMELAEFGWLPLIGQTGKAANGEFLNIVQHPEGGPKQLALRENRLIDKLPNHLHYESDTARGSSGAPVFNDQWEVVALHHAAYPRMKDGKVLAVGGGEWLPSMGEDKVDWVGNEGIRVSVLVAALGKVLKGLGGEQSGLLQALLDGQRAPWPPFHRRGRPWPPGKESLREPGPGGPSLPAGPSVAPDGSVTWTVPISLTVRLGGVAAPSAGIAAASPPAPEPAAAEPASPAVAPVESEEFRRLKRLHDEAAGRTYYDPATDDAARGAYYGGIDPEDADKDALRNALSELLKETHATKLAYRPQDFVYPWVDKREDGTLRSIYSGASFDAEEIIRADLEVARLRESAAAAMRSLPAEEALDLMESSLPFNCEHVVPQSWFGKSNPERGDLHHLFTCESGCNSFRGNIPYFDFPDFEEAVRDACGKRETERFEPSAGKGAVARATLYFLLRYPGTIDATYKKDRLRMLARWSDAKPVDRWEQHRNAEIERMQGNRNPFIDFPGLALHLFG
jgi:endonuclease G